MSYLDYAAERDYRTTAIDERWWDAIAGNRAHIEWAEESESTFGHGWVPIRFDVCPACDGRGKYVNPSIDAHGLTRDDLDEDPDFAEGYFRGDYDVPCVLCRGDKVVPVPDDPVIRKMIEAVIVDREVDRRTRLYESGIY